MSDDFLKSIIGEIPEEMKQDSLRDTISQEVPPGKELDPVATAIATGALSMLLRMREIYDDIEESAKMTGEKLPAGDTIMVGAFLTAGYALGQLLMDEAKKSTDVMEIFSRLHTLTEASLKARVVFKSVGINFEELLKAPPTMGVSRRADGSVFVAQPKGEKKS